MIEMYKKIKIKKINKFIWKLLFGLYIYFYFDKY
jgi:hypothetical protein